MKCLIVDDQASNRLLLKSVLDTLDHSSVQSDSVNQMFEVLDEDVKFDVIFLDYLMPDKDGDEAVILLEERGINIPIIIVTAMSNTKLATKFLTSGVTDYVLKPFNRDDIMSSLNKVEVMTLKKKYNDRLILKEKTASLGLLASGIGHEIGNPTAILTLALEMMKDFEEKRTSKQIEICLEQVNRITKIVETLSYFNRTKRRDDKFFVNDILENIINLFKMQYNNIDFKYSSDSEIQMFGSQSEVQQIIVIIVNNAIDSITSPKKVVEIELTKNNGRFSIFISDNGEGINEENKRKIFDTFFSTKGDKGTGLGLSICHQLIEKNHGDISFESTIGKGTTFEITFKGETSE